MSELAQALKEIFEADESGDVDVIFAEVRKQFPNVTQRQFLRAMDEYEGAL